jgi:hypothetical protein
MPDRLSDSHLKAHYPVCYGGPVDPGYGNQDKTIRILPNAVIWLSRFFPTSMKASLISPW